MLNWLSSVFLIASVTCSTQFGPCPPDLSAPAQFLVGRPLYLPLPRPQIDQLYRQYPQVASVSFSRRFPASVTVFIQLRRPVATVSPDQFSQNSAAFVDESGLVFSSATASALPHLVIPSPLEAGKRLSKNQQSAIKILSSMGHLFSSRLIGRLDGSILYVNLPVRTTLVIDIDHPPASFPAPLQSILARSRIDGKMPRKIDMRFGQIYEE